MSENRREGRQPLFEMAGYPILDFQISDGEKDVSFVFVVQADHAPEPEEFKTGGLFEVTGCFDVLRKKGWIDNKSIVLVPLKLERECTVEGPGTYRLKFNLTREDEN